MKRFLFASVVLLLTPPVQAQETPVFDTIVSQCEARVKAPRNTLQRGLAMNNCVFSHPSYSQIDANAAAYMAKRAALFAQVKRGEIDYQTAQAESLSLRKSQIAADQREQRQIALQEQQISATQNIANEVSWIPLEQARWYTVFQGINISGRGYRPHMYSTHY